MYKRTEEKGITLIALVVTIVILLILAGISINLTLGQNGIIARAVETQVKQDAASVSDAVGLRLGSYYIDSQSDESNNSYMKLLENDNIIDENGIVNVENLIGKKLKTGNGTDKKDVYALEDNHLYYYDKKGEKNDLETFENLGKTVEQEVADLFIIDDSGNIDLKDKDKYYCKDKEWTIENLVIPSKLNGKEVKGISDFFTSYPTYDYYTCLKMDKLKTVKISEGITRIGKNSFEFCDGITDIELPDTITEIGDSAFADCKNLINLNIPSSVINVESSIFDNTPYYNNLPDGEIYINNVLYDYKGEMPENTKIIIKPGTVSIADVVFRDCTGLVEVEIPDSVTELGGCTFDGCTNLSKINIPESITTINTWEFRECKKLANIQIPNNVKTIDNAAFKECELLNNVIIPDTVTYIGDDAFSDCYSLENINIPTNIDYIGGNALAYTPYGRKFADGEVYIGNTFYEYKGDMPENTSITIKDGTKYIAAEAFREYPNLKGINLPNSIVSIGYSAFDDCTGLTNFEIPSSLNKICCYAFAGCTGINTIIIPNTVKSTEHNIFNRWTSTQTISVPFEEFDRNYNGWDSDWKDGCDATIIYKPSTEEYGEMDE